MSGAVATFLRSRPVRKFVRSRMAIAALAVIGLYALIGCLGLVGVISVRDAEQRVGANTLRGLGLKSAPEKRLDHAAFYLDWVGKALKPADFEAAKRDAALAERRVADLPKEELQRLVDEGLKKYLEIAMVDDIATVPDLESSLVEIESIGERVIPVPEGGAGLLYRLRMSLGTDRQGRSILMRSLYSVMIALKVGVVVGIFSVIIGSILGALAAFFRGWVDQAVQWLYSTFSSIPNLVLLALLVYMFQGSPWKIWGTPIDSTLIPVYVALSATFWIGPCRIVRGEVIKIRELEYVQAATAIGFGRFYVVMRHVLPNTIHLMLINFSLLFIAAIKSEVILTFLGLGVKKGASWGLMITQAAQEVINGFFWQIGTATVFMFVLVLAFNILSDALQDAFDPKHVG
jgi:peptide/nickel transport system permease protein